MAYLGVGTVTVTPGLAFQFNLPVRSGAYVENVAPGGPAEKAGIAQGDVIVALDGRPVASYQQLGTLIHAHSPGDSATVTVVHPDGTRQTSTVTLGVNPLP